jgi:hypothetical protein
MRAVRAFKKLIKSILFPVANVLIVLIAVPIYYKFYGMAGLAAVLAFQPILYGVYCLVHGTRNCQ